ncbi:endo-1,4-beta-xylanase [Anaerosporobacter sp.]|uniref:endo-1,4-beta-xylanase n=1 Tax=Anaerosporobacter sp. TaxID=1872529 RepID=UPI00286F9DA8|nr:endo-1,4-beta-xylanase [Anaerosporobacter sp.]
MRRKLKKLVVLMMAAVFTLESMIPQNVLGAEVGGAARTITQNVLDSKNTNFEGADGSGVPYWWYNSSATLSLSDDCYEGSKSMKVVPSAVGSYVGAASNMTDSLETGVEYEYSYYAKLAEPATQGQVALVLNYIYADDYSDTKQVLADVDESYTFTSENWVNVTGTFTVAPEDGKDMKGIHLVFSAVDSDTAFLVDDFKVGTAAAVVGDNLIYDAQFSDVSSAWYAYASDAQFTRGTNDIADQGILGEGYGYITGRTQNWECIGQDIADRVKNNTNYQISFYAKLADDYGSETRTIQLCTTKKDSNDSGDQYDKLTLTGGSATVSASEWTKIEGTLLVKWTGDLEKLTFKISEQGLALNNGNYGSFYVANVQMYEVETPKKEIETNIKDLKEQFAGDINAKAGVAIPGSALSDDVRMALVTKHFNSITAENEMKPDSILGQQPNIGADGYPVLNFSNADGIMDYIYDYNEANPDKEPIKVRGHVLVWHSQTPEWFFHEEYDAAKPYVSSAVMLGRLENYIAKVMDHFDGADSKYKGMIYAWDVVNEAINDSNGGLRTTGSSWYNVFGDSSFITQAFVYANTYAPADVKLFYNDYNDTNDVKAAGICELIKEIKATPGARIDGMGMQAHYDMSSPSVGQFVSAAKAYAAALGEGKELQLTELDFKSSNDYDGSDKNAEYQKQAYRYKAIYDAIISLEEEGIDFGAITIWGTHDSASWLQSSNSVGGAADGNRKQCPLLFDDNFKAKPAYWAFVDASKLEPFILNGVAIQTNNIESAVVKQYSFHAGDAEVTFSPIWNENGLKVQVKVKDATVNNTDKITIYVDSQDSRCDGASVDTYTVTRAQATVTADGNNVTTGYMADFTIPVSGLAVMKKIGMDIKVTDNNTTGSWNDLTGNQENSSKYYGQVVMKPYMEIGKGTVTIDGTIDSIWAKVDAVPFSIRSNSPEATATAKLLWDDNYLYTLIQVRDSVLNKSNAAAHEQDSVEVFIDENNHKTESYEADDKQYRINFSNEASFNGANCNADNLRSSVVVTNDGYYVEAAYKWTEITPEMLALIGLEMQINDASAAGSRVGTMSWYDESGMGWSSTAVFGTAMLGETVKVDPQPQPQPQPQAQQEPVSKYSVSINGGSGSGSYEVGTTVTIIADAAANGKEFDKWVVESGSVELADATKATTTFTMPAQAVSIKATYKTKITYFAKFSTKNVSIQKGKKSTALASDLKIATGDKVKEWKSSNKEVVSVDKNGKINAKKTGSAVITVTTQKGKKASVTVKVVSGKVATTKLTVQNNATGKNIKSGSSVTLKVKKTLELKAVVTPLITSDTVTYSTSDKKVATVSSTGKITAKKKGTATITIKSGKKTVKVKIVVK